jgi:hypothetical protein
LRGQGGAVGDHADARSGPGVRREDAEERGSMNGISACGENWSRSLGMRVADYLLDSASGIFVPLLHRRVRTEVARPLQTVCVEMDERIAEEPPSRSWRASCVMPATSDAGS